MPLLFLCDKVTGKAMPIQVLASLAKIWKCRLLLIALKVTMYLD